MIESPSVVIVHGGAGRAGRANADETRRARRAVGLRRAVEAAQAVLRGGGAAAEAVVEAVVVLEDDELFNAGRGAVPCADGTIELSASLMDGATLAVGAMVGLRRTRHPIRGAASLLGHRHSLLFGERADAFAAEAGLARAEPESFWSEARRLEWIERGAAPSAPDDLQGTVGAVALDRRGTLAAATSTGGIYGQLPGRVGDTPVAGAGSFANGICAISATGDGDFFLRASFARRVADLVELAGLSLERAIRRGLDEVAQLGGLGGCIAIDARGRIAAPFSAERMSHAWARGDAAARVRIDPDDGEGPLEQADPVA